MKKILSFSPLLLIIAAGCATIKPSQETYAYENVKTCENKSIKIDFFIFNPSGKPDEDILTKKLIVKIEIFESGYGALTLWLSYGATEPPEKRNLPENQPKKIIIQTKSVVKKVSKKDFADLWRGFMSPANLTFIENCLFS